MDKNNAPPPLYTAQGKPAGRIRQKNEETILAAAAEEFARYGFKGTSMNAIASRAGLPKAQVGVICHWPLGISGSDGHTYYGEFSPRLSLGKISGADLSFGPVKDVLISATYERGEGRNRNYLLGPAVDLAIPGFDRFALNTYYRKPDGITGKPSGQWQITPTWAMTFPVGKSDILFDGYIDWVVNDKKNGNTELKKNFHFNPQVKYDLGKALDYTPGKLYVGIEYDYWSNKYGIEDTDAFNTDNNVTNFIVKAHF